MDTSEIKKAIDLVTIGKAVLLDVRRDEEWNAGHSAVATHFDSDRILAFDQLPDIEKDKTIYVHCLSGGRAGRVKNKLIEAGFANVYNLGGLSDWQNAGGK